MLVLIFLLVFAAVSSSAWVLLSNRNEAVQRRLGIVDEPPGRGSQAARRGFLRRGVAASGSRLPQILPSGLVGRIRRMLIMANEPWSLGGFLTSWAVVVVFAVLFVVYLAAVRGLSGTQVFSLSATVLPMAIMGPYAVLRRRVINRQTAIIRALPDGLDLLITCVEAGMATDAAFATVVAKTEGPLSETFSYYLKQAGLGLSRKDALLDVAERSGVRQLVALATSVSRGEELGTSLGDVLRLQAEDLRAERRERAHSAAQRAPVLMTIPLVVCFMPAMAAVVIVPSILNLIRFVGTIGN